jgi:hypothetical protein
MDHLCCMVEARVESGLAFKVALQDALHELSPKGLDEIQRQTDLLLNPNFISMKMLMYSIGLVTSMSFTMGLMMKLLHMRGGEELINYGFLGFALLVIPMNVLSRYKADSFKASHEKLKMLFAMLSAVCTGLAVFLKLTVNLDESGIMLIVGASVFSFGFLPLHFFAMYRKSVVD